MDRTIVGERLCIGFVSPCGLADKRGASGAPFRMGHALAKYCGQIVDLGPLKRPSPSLVRRAIWKAERTLTGRRRRWKSTRAFCRKTASLLEGKLETVQCDLLFCAMAGWDMALLETNLPVFDCTDLTLELAIRLCYPGLHRLSERSIEEAREINDQFIRKAAAHIVATKWAADSLANDYGIPMERIFITPFGANLDDEDIPPRETVLAKKVSPNCRLLFLADAWYEKGGDIAFETLIELEKLGISAHLTVCGCTPPTEIAHEQLTVIPYLDKNDDMERKRLMALIASSDFLFLPTRRDTFGHVFCEANAYGVPAIATDVGGVAEVIRDGVNGYTLPLSAGPADYAELIRDIYLDDEKYRRLVLGSRDEFEQRLNWDVWGRGVAECMRKVLPADLAAKVGPA